MTHNFHELSHSGDPQTSRRAAVQSGELIRTNKKRILLALCQLPQGATCDQIALKAGMRYEAVSRRIHALKADGLVRTGGRGITNAGFACDVLHITVAGRKLVQE